MPIAAIAANNQTRIARKLPSPRHGCSCAPLALSSLTFIKAAGQIIDQSNGMKRRTILTLSVFALTLSAVRGAWAQPQPQPQPQGTKNFKPEELDQMLAPIALYPDPLLSQILMAAGYPLEVVEAARWQQANPALKGDAAVAAVA